MKNGRGSRWAPLTIGIAALVLVIITVPAGCFAPRDGEQAPTAIESPTPAGSPAPTEPTLQPGEAVTEEKLSQVSAADFYWSALTRQAIAPVSVVTRAHFPHPSDFEKHQRYDVTQIGVDHRTGKDVWTKSATIARTSYRSGKADVRRRCVDGEEYELRADADPAEPWQRSASPSCDFDTLSAAVGSSDGIVASGLSRQQAGLMIFALRNDYPGFADPRRPSLVTASGKTYIRQIVEYRPYRHDGTYWGTKIFSWALQKAGLEPRNWPFWPGLHTRAGLHVAYYFDTSTLLPVASVVRTTPVLADDGSVMERHDQTVIHNYRFPERLIPLDLEGTAAVSLIIPEGWTIPK